MGTVCLMIASYLRGWIVAHNVVANECRKLGKFYVGSTVFHCTKIEEKE